MKKALTSWPAGIIVALVIGGATGLAISQINFSSTSKIVAVKNSANLRPEFTSSAMAGWYSTPYYPSTSTVDSFELSSNDSSCSISTFHKKGSVNVAKKIKRQEKLSQKTGAKMTPIGTKTASLATQNGARDYRLHEFRVGKSPVIQTKNRGLALGYIELADSYISISVGCKRANQLDSAIPAMQSIKFNPNSAIRPLGGSK